jgi:hypothetical protein
VREAAYPLRPGPGALENRFDGGQHPDVLLSGCARDLRRVYHALVVDEHRIGERPADIDPEQHRPKQ